MLVRVSILALLLSTATFAQPRVPTGPLAMRDFRLQFDPAGTFSLVGQGWPAMSGTWALAGAELTLVNQSGPANCAGAARYTLNAEGTSIGLDVIADDCQPRRIILERSRWAPAGVEPPRVARHIVRSAGPAKTPLTRVTPGPGDWPSFRGRDASGISDRQNLPDTWNPATGENIFWRTPIPGLATQVRSFGATRSLSPPRSAAEPKLRFKPRLVRRW